MHRNLWLHTLPDCTTFADAVRMLKKWGAWEEAPAAVRAHLLRGDPAQETVKAGEFEQMDFRVFGVMPGRLGMVPAARQKACSWASTPIPVQLSQAEGARGGFYAGGYRRQYQKDRRALRAALRPVYQRRAAGHRRPGARDGGTQPGIRPGRRASPGWKSGDRGRGGGLDGTDGPGGQFWAGSQPPACLAGGIVDGASASAARRAGIDLHDALRRHTTPRAVEDGATASWPATT